MRAVVPHVCTQEVCALHLARQGPGGLGVVVASWASVACQEGL